MAQQHEFILYKSFKFSVVSLTRILYRNNYIAGTIKDKEIAQRLRDLREGVDISQAKIAILMGATQASVNRYENQQSSPPLKVLLWYADFFDLSMDYILCRTEKPQGKLYESKPRVMEAITQG